MDNFFSNARKSNAGEARRLEDKRGDQGCDWCVRNHRDALHRSVYSGPLAEGTDVMRPLNKVEA